MTFDDLEQSQADGRQCIFRSPSPKSRRSTRTASTMLRCVVNDIVPSTAFAVGLLTLIVPFVIVRVNHTYIGGLEWPFVADLSRDYPSSIVFVLSLNTLALLIIAMWMLNYRRHVEFLEKSQLDEPAIRSFGRFSYLCNVTGAVGACALPLYVTALVATIPHRLAGGAFLVFEALACIVNSYLSYRICLAKREELETGVFVTIKFAPRSVAIEKLTALKKAKRGFLVELACSALFLMSLLVYLPILYQVDPPVRLPIAECIARGFGDHYCKDTVRLNQNETSLWNYEADFAGFQVRAFAQLGCLLTLLTYSLSFVVSNNERAENQQQERDQQYLHAASPKSPLMKTASESVAVGRGRRRSRSRPGSPTKPPARVRSPSGSPKRTSYPAGAGGAFESV